MLRGISQIFSCGGTDVTGALDAAFRSLKEMSSRRRYLLFITDLGLPGLDDEEFRALVGMVKDAGFGLPSREERIQAYVQFCNDVRETVIEGQPCPHSPAQVTADLVCDPAGPASWVRTLLPHGASRPEKQDEGWFSRAVRHNGSGGASIRLPEHSSGAAKAAKV